MHAWFRENAFVGHQKRFKDIDATGKDGDQPQ